MLLGSEKNKTKQPDSNHTQEDIGHSHSLQIIARANQGTAVQEEQKSIVHIIRTTWSLSHETRAEGGWNMWNGNFIITICNLCILSMKRFLWGWDMKTRNGNLLINDRVESTCRALGDCDRSGGWGQQPWDCSGGTQRDRRDRGWRAIYTVHGGSGLNRTRVGEAPTCDPQIPEGSSSNPRVSASKQRKSVTR
jgi:hypothetical protein